MNDYRNNDDYGDGGRGGDGGPRSRRFKRVGPRVRPQAAPEEPLEYKNIGYLGRLLSPQGQIMSRKRTGFSGQDQRELARAVKRARFLALLPYVG
jgi:small subunit ribosomal protein S18